MQFVFRKCKRQSSSIEKAKSKKAATLKRLRSFLALEESLTVRWLVSFWDEQQAVATYKELREFALNGWIPDEQLEKWQYDYAILVNTKLAPQWQKAMAAAVEEQQKQFHYFLYEPSVGATQAYIQEHGAKLVTNLVNEQKDAIQAMVSQASHYNGMTPDSLSRIIRPVIGLTKPQAKANLRYWYTIWQSSVEMGLSDKKAEKRATEMAKTYAARQHRYRAMNIARTELAAAYNQGGYVAVLDAQEKGYMGDCKKVWLTADDERVCPYCGGADGESVNMNDAFSNGAKLPPAHPQCRCAVAYEEINENLNPTTGSGSGIIEPQDITIVPTGQTVVPETQTEYTDLR